MRSRRGLRAVGLSLAVLGLAAIFHTIIYIASGSIALLADLIHNVGDASTAIPLGIAFLLPREPSGSPGYSSSPRFSFRPASPVSRPSLG
jgi:divalent metal cation (Fe/Co/Zn/Cd) transporter